MQKGELTKLNFRSNTINTLSNLLATKAATSFSFNPWIWVVGFAVVGVGYWMYDPYASSGYTKIKELVSNLNTFYNFNTAFGPLKHIYRDINGVGHFKALLFHQIPEQDNLRVLLEIGRTTLAMLLDLLATIYSCAQQNSFDSDTVNVCITNLKNFVAYARYFIFLRVLHGDIAQWDQLSTLTAAEFYQWFQTEYVIHNVTLNQTNSILRFFVALEVLFDTSECEKLYHLCRGHSWTIDRVGAFVEWGVSRGL